MLRDKRSHRSEKPAHRNEEQPLLTTARESPRIATKTQRSQKNKFFKNTISVGSLASVADGLNTTAQMAGDCAVSPKTNSLWTQEAGTEVRRLSPRVPAQGSEIFSLEKTPHKLLCY